MSRNDPVHLSAFPGEQQLVFWRSRLADQAYVYVMHNPGETLFKVGYSVDPFDRLASLRLAHPGLKLRYVIPGSKRLEKLLHKRGASARVYERGNEWFSTQDAGVGYLLLLERLAEVMQESYDDSGIPPVLPAFNSSRSEEELEVLHREIERHLIDGWSLKLLCDRLDATLMELETEAYRMRELGGFHCFFEEADPLDRKRLALRS